MQSHKTKIIRDRSHWAIGHDPSVLKQIEQDHINIVVYERNVKCLSHELWPLLNQKVELSAIGDIDTIIHKLSSDFADEKTKLLSLNRLLNDIKQLLLHFQAITESKSFRLILASIDTDMCKRFHTDTIDLRMLCTYNGPGTLWLTEENINRQALNSYEANDCIVLDESQIQQISTGSVAILKGSTYSKRGTKAVVHRSPEIEVTNKQRLLLRIDTNNI